MAEPNSRTLLRGLRILTLFQANPALSQVDIAERLRLPLPTVGRLCRALTDEDFLQRRDGTRKLVLGPALRDLAHASQLGTQDLGRQWMAELRELFNEDAVLAYLDGSEVVYKDSAPADRTLNIRTVRGGRVAAHTVAVGKALLAQLDDDAVQQTLGPGPYPQHTARTISTWPELRAELNRIRHDSIARTWEEYADGIASFAIAVPTLSGEQQTGLAITMPTARANAQRAARITEELRRRRKHPDA